MLYFLATVGGFVLFCIFYSLLWRMVCSLDSVEWQNNIIVSLTKKIGLLIKEALMAIVILIKMTFNLFIQIISVKPKTWRDDAPTEKQIQYADDLDINYSDNITKGELSDLIDAAKRK